MKQFKTLNIFNISIVVSCLFILSACNSNTGLNENNNFHNENTNNNETQIKDNDNNNNEDDDDPWLGAYESTDSDLSILVNKGVELGPDDHPDDLVTVDVPTILDNPEVNQLREEASDALSKMFAKAKEDGFTLYARSGFRSYQTQEQLFASYVVRNGEEAANRYSARPGQSEHQTGLTMDVTAESVSFDLEEEFGNTDEGQWIEENAHKFGFIIRYPKDKEDITGYIYEPWHLRYLTVDLATAVYESGLTYEEFLEKIGKE